MPPQTTNADGEIRKVGVEIEFGGITGREAAAAIAQAVGGTIDTQSAHRHRICGTPIGDVTVELDTRYVHGEEPETVADFTETAREKLGDLVQIVVPHELVTPPVPVHRLHDIETFVDALREAGAIGTATNPFHGFGLHLNPEIASRGADYLLRVLRAFILLNDWLRDQIRPDATRRMLAWASPYDEPYVLKIIVPNYAPSLEQLIADYVAANSGRNFDLDMSPLFSELDGELMQRLTGDSLIAPRPTFHYRLPDSRVDEPGWSLAEEWNRWVAVEKLAEDPDLIQQMTAAYLAGERTIDLPEELLPN